MPTLNNQTEHFLMIHVTRDANGVLYDATLVRGRERAVEILLDLIKKYELPNLKRREEEYPGQTWFLEQAFSKNPRDTQTSIIKSAFAKGIWIQDSCASLGFGSLYRIYSRGFYGMEEDVEDPEYEPNIVEPVTFQFELANIDDADLVGESYSDNRGGYDTHKYEERRFREEKF